MKTFHSTTDGEHYAIPITKAKQRETRQRNLHAKHPFSGE